MTRRVAAGHRSRVEQPGPSPSLPCGPPSEGRSVDRAAECRERANACRRNAQAATRERDRAEWLKLADEWLRLAEKYEGSTPKGR
jgi:hypothetical protein